MRGKNEEQFPFVITQCLRAVDNLVHSAAPSREKTANFNFFYPL